MRPAVPERGGREQPDDLGHCHHEEIHHESAPYHEPGLPVSPYLHKAVVDDIGYRENDHSSRQRDGTGHEKLCLEKV